MIESIAQVTFPHHKVHIARDDQDGNIHLFKHDHDICDFIITPDIDEAADWIMAPLPLLQYRVVLSDE